MYIFDNQVVEISEKLKPSARGELEITDVIKAYLEKGELKVHRINRSCAWLDAGTCESMDQAGEYVRVVEQRQGVKVGCPEEAALKSGFLNKQELKKEVDKMPNVEYKSYLERICK